jgi:hypothetical protein
VRTANTLLWVAAGTLVLGAAVTAACGGADPFIGADEDGGQDGTAPGNDAAPQDGGGSDGGNPSDAPTGFDAGDPDVIIAPVPDGGCGEVADSAKGAFVSKNTTNPGTADCTPQAPCPTITQGIAWAQKNARPFVYVEKGTYVEQVKLVGGVTVRGGWLRDAQGQWLVICDGTARVSSVVIQAPDAEFITVLADNLSGGKAGLDTLFIQPHAAAAQPGQSFYGVFIRGASSVVDMYEVGLGVKSAGNGSPGSPGSPGAGAGSCSTPGGPAASPGGAGAGGQLGTFDTNGYTPGDGKQGGTGTAGPNGTAVAPQCSDAGACADCIVQQPDPGLPRVCDTTNPTQVCGTAAVIGCGSAGGGGGVPGKGGGSSVALYVWGGTANIRWSSLTAGSGGSGGQGGGGGSPGTPSTAVQGDGGKCYSPSNPTCATSLVDCRPIGAIYTPIPGGTATNGAPGGTGGPGGGGAGGSTYVYYTGGGGAVNVVEKVTLQTGTAGPAGPPNGAAGVSAQHN